MWESEINGIKWEKGTLLEEGLVLELGCPAISDNIVFLQEMFLL